MTEKDYPADFRAALGFHGHLCRGLTLGYRAARAAMEHLGVERSEDEELVAVVETDSCAADAIQVLTGCTFGKGNFVFLDYGKMAFTLWSRNQDRGVRVSRRHSIKDQTDEELMAMPTEELFDLKPGVGPIPGEARIHDSEPCALCGEKTMVTRLEETARGRVCRGCAKAPAPPPA